MFSEVRRGGLLYLTAPLFPAVHAFTTRYGGVSEGVFASLNLGESRGDDIESVRENYRRVKDALGVQRLCFTHQIHENKVRYVTSADAREPGDKMPPDCDGLVTDEEGLGLIIFIADCAPILLCDEKRHIIAAAHAGWRGTVADIAGKAVEAMAGLGSDRRDIRAAIGPCISKCCFETGPEVPEAVMNVLEGAGEEFIAPSPAHAEKYTVDLKGVNKALLIKAGLRQENIEVSDQCTACHTDRYWSHRVLGPERGSQAAIVVNRRA